MNLILFLLILLIITNQTYVSYLIFILIILNIILNFFLLGYYFLGLLYLFIYIGSIAIIFLYLLMLFSFISKTLLSGSLLIFIPIILSFFLLGLYFPIFHFYQEIENILDYSTLIYNHLLIPISFSLLISMIFVIRYI